MKIFVGGLPLSVQEDELKNYFEQYGTVSSANLVKDNVTESSRGFAYVEMKNEQEATIAIQELNRIEVDGRTIVVNPGDEQSNRGQYQGPEPL
jgi:RNA recognition motif-containing protein